MNFKAYIELNAQRQKHCGFRAWHLAFWAPGVRCKEQRRAKPVRRLALGVGRRFYWLSAVLTAFSLTIIILLIFVYFLEG